MTPEEFAKKMQEIWDRYYADEMKDDPEKGHIEADKLMREALVELGYEEGINICDNMSRWYS